MAEQYRKAKGMAKYPEIINVGENKLGKFLFVYKGKEYQFKAWLGNDKQKELFAKIDHNDIVGIILTAETEKTYTDADGVEQTLKHPRLTGKINYVENTEL